MYEHTHRNGKSATSRPGLAGKRDLRRRRVVVVSALLSVPAGCWKPEKWSRSLRQICAKEFAHAKLVGVHVGPAQANAGSSGPAACAVCAVCGWQHDAAFTQIRISAREVVSLAGVLPDIVRLVHQALEKGFPRLSTKDDALLNTCGGYRNPCKAFDDLKRRREYKLLFDTRRRGFIALRGAVGRTRNKSEASPE